MIMAGWGSDLGPRLCQAGAVLETEDGSDEAKCDLHEGHQGAHHDFRLGLEWPEGWTGDRVTDTKHEWPPPTVQVEIWGQIFGSDTMHRMGTIDYRLQDGTLISDDELRFSIDQFRKAMEEAFAEMEPTDGDAG
jgi:hypothetical protein